MNTRDRIIHECYAIRDLLLAKNEAYGDSALDPVRVFSSAEPAAGIRIRIDDKLSRLKRGSAAGEDVTLDLIGYLILLRIAERPEANEPDVPEPRPADEARLFWRGDQLRIDMADGSASVGRVTWDMGLRVHHATGFNQSGGLVPVTSNAESNENARLALWNWAFDRIAEGWWA